MSDELSEKEGLYLFLKDIAYHLEKTAERCEKRAEEMEEEASDGTNVELTKKSKSSG